MTKNRTRAEGQHSPSARHISRRFADVPLPDLRGYAASGIGAKRTVRCGACGDKASVSIVTHLKKKHPDLWDRFVDHFVELRRKGVGYKEIMWRFQRLFSWTVIARALAERGGILPPVRKATTELTPKDFKYETTTKWSFQARGAWALHDSAYRGNWPPQVPRNLIHRYSKPRDLVLDPFVGGGTTAIEAALLNRRFVGVDINKSAVDYATKKLRNLRKWFDKAARNGEGGISTKVDARVFPGNASDLKFVENNSVDLICAHPPYLDIIPYTHDPADLSTIRDIDRFKVRLRRIVLEFYRVLKDRHFCCVQIGDVRQGGKFIPLGFETMRTFMTAFDLKEVIVKDQPKTGMDYFWKQRAEASKLLRIAHEYIFVFQKNDGLPAPLKIMTLLPDSMESG